LYCKNHCLVNFEFAHPAAHYLHISTQERPPNQPFAAAAAATWAGMLHHMMLRQEKAKRKEWEENNWTLKSGGGGGRSFSEIELREIQFRLSSRFCCFCCNIAPAQ
jgi:hypothetical protein